MNTLNSVTTENLLAAYGFNDFFIAAFEKDRQAFEEQVKPARVLTRNRQFYELITSEGKKTAFLSGKYSYETDTALLPVAGDWVLYHEKSGQALILHTLERQSKFSRKEAGQVTNEQVLAANIDWVFIVTGLDGNYNLSRMLRYKTVVIDGGAKPAFVLNKLDLCDDLEVKLAEVRKHVGDAPILPVSSFTGEGLEALKALMGFGETIAFFGSSGVGKSSLTNALFHTEVMATGAVSSAHGKGRHTTTTAALNLLPEGGILIDTPGIREIQIWCDEDAVEAGFEDIALLSTQCQFEDCKHAKEPNCAVKAALHSGELSEKHYQNYLALKREAKFMASKQKMKDKQKDKPTKNSKPRQKRFEAYLED